MSVLFMVTSTLILLVTTLVGGSAFLSHRAEVLEQRAVLERDLNTAASQLATSLSLPVWTIDRPQIRRILDSLMEDRKVQGLSLRFGEGGLESMERSRHPDWTIRVVGQPPTSPPGSSVGNQVFIEHDITHEGEFLGSFKLTYTTRFLDAELKQLLVKRLLRLALLAGLIIASLSFLLWRLVLKPILEIQKLASLVSAGAPGSVGPVQNSYYGELAHLQNSIWQAFRLLQERYSALQASEERFRELSIELRDSSQSLEFALLGGELGTWDWNPQTGMVRYSDHWARMLGYEPEEVQSDVEFFKRCVHPQDLPQVMARLEAHVAGSTPMYESEHRVQTKSGESRWMLDRGKVVKWDPQGLPIRATGVASDITNRKRDEEKLNLSNFLGDQALDLTHAGYWHVPLDGSGWYNSSERAATVYGDPPREGWRYHIMDDWFANVEAGDKAAAARTMENFTAAIEGRVPEYNSVYAYRRPADGRIIWIHALGRVIRSVNGDRADMYGVTQDITEQVHAEAALQRSQANMTALIESTTDLIWSVDRNHRLVTYNATLSDHFRKNYGTEVRIGSQSRDFLPPDRAKPWPEMYLRAERDGPYQQEHSLPDGRTLELSFHPILQDGAFSGVSVFGKDITARKQAEEALRESEERFNRAFQFMPVGAGITTLEEGRYLAVNRHYEEIFGYSQQELLGHTSGEFGIWAHAADRAHVVGLLQREQPVHSFEVQVRRKDGSLGWVSYSGELVTLNGVKCLLSGAMDINDRKRTEEELHRLNEHLEEVVEERTVALKEALHLAESANRAKSAFLANMSHELRTPLNSVLGFAQLMEREPNRCPRDLSKLGKIRRSGQHLLELINDVLTISRIEAHKLALNLSTFNLRTCIEGIDEMIRFRVEAKDLDLHIDIDSGVPTNLVGDEGKLRQVLLNLLSNAVKFTERGGLALKVHASGQGFIHFEVSDTGVGISPEELPQLFGTFVQTESGRRSAEGSGLGLNLSQALARLMGGEIRAESHLGQGSTFSLLVPLSASEAQPLNSRGVRRLALSEGQPALRQLVADDNSDNREVLTESLEAAGFPVRVVSNGAEAVDTWRHWQPQVVWMDMRMPVMDGYEATRRIRALEKDLGRPHTIILAVTASILENDEQALLEAGCDAVLSKPFRDCEPFEALARFTGLAFLGMDEPNQNPPRPKDLGGCDSGWREAFRTCLLAGDMSQALDLTRQLPATQGALANYLQQALQEFRLDELERLFSPLEMR